MAHDIETLPAVRRGLGLRVRELRRSLGLTQEELAEVLGMLTPNFARIEQGRQNVTLDTLVRLANALGVRVSDLMRTPQAVTVRPGRPKRIGPATPRGSTGAKRSRS
jgi:UDP-N-acetylglucosamine 1-carboxyvinyltransferase